MTLRLWSEKTRDKSAHRLRLRSDCWRQGGRATNARMKTNTKSKTYLLAVTLAALCAAEAFAESAGPGFTYQGRLNDGGVPAKGNYDMIFNLYDAPANGNSLGNFSIFGAVPVTNGLFTVELNRYGEFGANAFNGQARWLQIGVRTNNNNALNPWVDLSPRQALTQAPHATFAMNASNAANAS